MQTGYEKRATCELANMIKANSFLGALTTPQEEIELSKMKVEMRKRKKEAIQKFINL